MSPTASCLAGSHDAPGHLSCTELPSPALAALARERPARVRAPAAPAHQDHRSPRRRSTLAGHQGAERTGPHSRRENGMRCCELAAVPTIGQAAPAPGTHPCSERARDRTGQYPRRRLRGEAQSQPQRLATTAKQQPDRPDCESIGLQVRSIKCTSLRTRCKSAPWRVADHDPENTMNDLTATAPGDRTASQVRAGVSADDSGGPPEPIVCR